MELKNFNNFTDNFLNKSNILDATQSNFVVVDKDLNIIYHNKEGIQDDDNSMQLLRPGDLFTCVNAVNSDGCGTSETCPNCKFRNTIYQVQKTHQSVDTDVTLMLANNTMVSFQVTATPFDYSGNEYVAVFLRNTSDKKRMEMMERVFFHDMLNLTGTLNNFIQIMEEDKSPEVFAEIKKLAIMISDQVTTQRDLIYAENGLLKYESGKIDINDVLSSLYVAQKQIAISKNKVLDGRLLDDSVTIETDAKLLSRVLLNMVKNAIEASEERYVIVVKPVVEGENLVISVHNPGYIKESMRSSIFQFGISTKGNGRGIGTYSMKLIGENYLKGRVWFTTSEVEGTTFYISIPLENKN